MQEGLLMENTSAEMSPAARQANTGKLGGWKPEESPEIALGVPQHPQQVDLFSGGLHSPRHDSVMGSKDLSWQQPAPLDCHILVLVEPSLLVHDCLFIRKNPAYFATNLYI